MLLPGFNVKNFNTSMTSFLGCVATSTVSGQVQMFGDKLGFRNLTITLDESFNLTKQIRKVLIHH